MVVEDRMDLREVESVAGKTFNLRAVHAVFDGLPDGGLPNLGAAIVVAEGTVGTVQDVNV